MVKIGWRNSVFRPFSESVCHQGCIGISGSVRRYQNVKVAEKAHVRRRILAFHQTRTALEQDWFDVDCIERGHDARKRLEQYQITPPIERQYGIEIIANFA